MCFKMGSWQAITGGPDRFGLNGVCNTAAVRDKYFLDNDAKPQATCEPVPMDMLEADFPGLFNKLSCGNTEGIRFYCNKFGNSGYNDLYDDYKADRVPKPEYHLVISHEF